MRLALMPRLTSGSLAWTVLTFLTVIASPTHGAAQEAMATAPNAADGGAPPAPRSDTTLRLSDHLDRGPDFARPRGPCGGPAKNEEGKTDKTPHGEVWAGAGSRGYREAGGVVCVPLGDKTAVTIAVDAGQINGRGGRR